MGTSKREFEKTRSLYRISEEQERIMHLLEDNQGELTESIDNALQINETDLMQKSESYIAVINKLDSEADYITKEIARLTAIKKARINAIERMKQAIKKAMIAFDVDKMELHLNKLSLRKSESVVINCEVQELPKQYQKIEIKPISKTEIKKDLKAGKKIKGVELQTNLNLQIK